MNQNENRHPVLPKSLNEKELITWLRGQSVGTFIDTNRDHYSPEEIAEFEHESSLNGREYNRLSDISKKVSELVKKGTETAVTITIPATAGTKMLETQRRQNDDLIERGYSEQDVEVYAIPYPDGRTMEFFNDEGKHYPERTRPLSVKELHQYGGIFNISSEHASSVDGNGEIIEAHKKTGTND